MCLHKPLQSPYTYNSLSSKNFKILTCHQTWNRESQAQKNRKIAQKQKETREKLKWNKVTMKKALAGQFDMPYRPVDNITLPQEFHFSTDERLGPSKHSGFASTLSLCLISTARYLRIGLVM